MYDGTKSLQANAEAAGYVGTKHSQEVTAARLLKNAEVSAAIAARVASVSGHVRKAIADRAARQAFWSGVMQDDMADMAARLKASELLGRSERDFVDRVEHSGQVSLEALILKAKASK